MPTSAVYPQIDSNGPNAITALTGDVTATGPGSAAAAVALVGGSTAAAVHTSQLATAAATDANTASTIVKRDGSGNFSAGTITAALTGTASNASGVTNAAVTGTLKAGNYHIEPGETDNGNSGTTKTIDLSTNESQKITLTGSVTLTLTNPQTGGAYLIKIVQGASSYTVTWPAAVKWPGGTAPVITTTNGQVDIIHLYYDGTDYFGSFAQNYTP